VVVVWAPFTVTSDISFSPAESLLRLFQDSDPYRSG
jgi:hypothetical protein